MLNYQQCINPVIVIYYGNVFYKILDTLLKMVELLDHL